MLWFVFVIALRYLLFSCSLLIIVPELIKWDYDNRFGTFDLYFDVLVRSYTFNISKMKMQSYQNDTGNLDVFSFGLFADDVPIIAQDINTTILTFHMDAESYAIMNSDLTTPVGRINTSTFLTLDADAVLNSYLLVGNTNIYNKTHALAVSNFLVDTVDPFVTEFSIDMDQGYINITSNEPIDPSTFTSYGTAYQSARNSYNGQGIYVQAVDQGVNTIFNLRNYGRTWSYYIPRADINNIKSDTGLCNTISDCYMSAWQPFVNDANGNPMTSVNYDVFFGMRATAFYPDISPPQLDYWGLDLNTGTIIIYFTEVIFYKSLNFSSISIYTKENTTNTSDLKGFRVINPVNVETQFTTDSVNRDIVYCQLSPAQVAYLYNIPEFQLGVSNSFLMIDKYAVKDTSVRENIFQGTGDVLAIQANYSVADVTRPEIASFDVNMTSQILTLRFTESIDPDSINVAKLSMQSQLSISAFTTTQKFDSTIVTVLPYNVLGTDLYIQFTSLGFAHMKNTGFLGISLSSSWIVAESLFCTDRALAKNPLVAVDAANSLGATNYFPDVIAPTLLSWDIDMSYDFINLTFSEPIDTATFNITELIIKSDSVTVESTIAVQLTDSTFSNHGYGSIIVYLSLFDLNLVKKQSPLCTSSTRCYIEFSSSLVADMPTYYMTGGKVQNKIEAVSGMMVSSFTSDTRAPILLSFGIDVNIGALFLNFNEPVKTRTFNSAGIILYADLTEAVTYHFSERSNADTEDDRSITVTMSRKDFRELKATGSVAIQISSTYMSLAAGTVSDMTGNLIAASVKSPFYLGASQFINDITSPTLVAVYYEIDYTLLHLMFDDAIVVNVLSLAQKSIFLAKLNSPGTALTTASIASFTDTAEILFNLVNMDASIKDVDDQNNKNIYVTQAGVLYDPALNPLEIILQANAVREGNMILTFRLDLTLTFMEFEMAFPLTPGFKLVMSQIVIHDEFKDVLYTMTNETSYTISTDGYYLKVLLSENDYFRILEQLRITDKTFIGLTVAKGAIVDTAGKNLGRTSEVSCSGFLPDVTDPVLSAWSVNLANGTLKMEFSKPMDMRFVKINAIRLLDANNIENSTSLYLEQTVLLPRADGYQYALELEFDLNAGVFPTDRDRLFLTQTIASSFDKTWITIDEGFMSDTAVPANFLPAIETPRAVTVLREDVSPPVLTRFDLNMATRRMTLTFNEGVNRTTNMPEKYLLISNPGKESSAQYQLTNSTVTELTSGTSGTNIVMILSKYDIDNIMLMAPNLLTQYSNTYIATTAAGAVRDLSRNANEMDIILFRFALHVTQFTADNVLPTIVSFDVNVNTGTLDIYFDEVVECAKTTTPYFKLQFASFIGTSTEFMFLTTASTVVCPLTYVLSVRILIGSVDLVNLRSHLVLYKSAGTTYIRPLSGAFIDVFGNRNAEVPDGRALAVAFYTADSVPPILKSFTVTSQRVLILTFNEPVKTSTLSVTGLSFQNAVSSPTFVQKLTTSTTFISADSTLRVLRFAMSTDYAAIVGVSSDVFARQITTFLTATSAVIQDTSGNPLTAIPSSFALALGPTIIEYSLNMNDDYIQLTFSETINSTHFSPVGVTIQNASTSSAGDVALTSSTPFVYVSTATYKAPLNSEDINLMKYNRVASSIDNTYLSVVFGLTNSLDVSTLIPLLKTVTIETYAAIPASSFVPDTTAPLCLDFGLDLNYGLLYMRYDEPVEPSSICTSCISLVVASTGKTVLFSVNVGLLLMNITTIRLNITVNDLNNLKLANKLGSINNLLLLPNAAVDYANNTVAGNSQLNPVLRSFFIPDTTPPRIISVSYDAGSGLIRVFFDEIIELNSLFPENVYLYDSAVTTGSFVQLTNYSIIELEASSGAVLIDTATFQQDANVLADQLTIATSKALTYLVILDARDVAGNSQSSATTAVQASSYSADTSQPRLVSFRLVRSTSGTDKYILNLFFSKVMDVDNFDCTDFILLSNYTQQDPALIYLQLTSATCSTASTPGTFTRDVEVFLPVSQFPSARIITSPGVDTGAVTFINTVAAPNSVDRLGISLVPVNNATTPEIIRPQVYQMGPQVLDYVVDLEGGTITIVFSEPVSRDLFRPTDLGFYSAASGLSTFCTSGTIMTGFELNSPVFNYLGVVVLSPADINTIKGIDVAQSDNMYMLVGQNMTKSAELFNVVELLSTNARVPVRYKSDSSAPVLLNVTLNMGSETLELEFDEPVRTETIVLTNIRIQNSAILDSQFSLKLTGGVPTIVGSRVTITLRKVDSAAIKLNDGLAKNISNSYISFDFGTIFDMAGNPLLPISTTNAYNVDTYIKDEIAPYMVAFNLDMDVGLLTLFFSEPVRVHSMSTGMITLQGGYASTPAEGYTLQETTILSPDASTIVTQLSQNDIHNIKLVRLLCRDRSSSFIVFPSEMVYDTSKNNVTAIVNGNSQPADGFVRDSHAPYVVSYEFDYDRSQIRLHFNELVQAVSIIPVSLTLYDAVSEALSTRSFDLTISSKGDFVVAEPFIMVVTINIAWSDLNYIKYLYPLASSPSTTYIAVLSNFVLDTFGNQMVAIEATAPMQVTSYLKDTIPPVITRYELDFFLGVIRLELSETVNIASFDDTQMTLQTTSVGRFGRRATLFGSVMTQEPYSNAYKTTITFSHDFFNLLKYNHIAPNKQSSFLQYSDRVIADYAGNRLPPLWDGSVQGFFPILPAQYVSDTALPTMDRWFIDTEFYHIHMLFDEPVMIMNATDFLFTTTTPSSTGQQGLLDALSLQGVNLQDLRDQLSPTELQAGLDTSFRIVPTSITYNAVNTEAIFAVADVCIDTQPVVALDGNVTYACVETVSFERYYYLLSLVRLTTYGSTISLSFSSDVAQDFAPKPNAIESKAVAFGLDIGDRDCSLCPTGQWVSKRCTLTKDRECSPCHVCDSGYFTHTACSSYDNTICQSKFLLTYQLLMLCTFILLIKICGITMIAL